MSEGTQNEAYAHYRKNGCHYITGNGDILMKKGNDIIRKDRATGKITIINDEMKYLGATTVDEHPDVYITMKEFEELMKKGI